ncbi:MAG: class I SAM-dependent methyltransferase [Chloroflexota bacterium]
MGNAKRTSDLDFKLIALMYGFRDLIRPPQRLLSLAGLEDGMSVVDYGCGPGSFTVLAAEMVGPAGKVFAVDIHHLALSSVRERASRTALENIETILVKGYDTGIVGSSIDRVLLIDTFHQIDDRQALLREIHRVLKGDGLLFMALGHMSMSQQKEVVKSTCLFEMVECWDKGMVFARQIKEEGA